MKRRLLGVGLSCGGVNGRTASVPSSNWMYQPMANAAPPVVGAGIGNADSLASNMAHCLRNIRETLSDRPRCTLGVYCSKDATGRRCVSEKHEAAAKLRWADPAFRARQSALAKARWADPNFRQKIMARLGDPGSRGKLSAAAKGRWAQPATREKLINSLKASHAAPATREKHSLASKSRWADPIMRAKIIAAMRAVRRERARQ